MLTTQHDQTILFRFRKARPMLSLALAFPLSYFTLLYVDSSLFFPVWSLMLIPILYAIAFGAIWKSWLKDHEWLLVGVYIAQMAFWGYLIWENGVTYGLTFTYWVYLLFTSNTLTRLPKLQLYYLVTFLVVSVMILLNPVQNPDVSPLFFEVQYMIIYFLLYVMTSQRINTDFQQVAMQSKLQSSNEEVEDLIDSLGAMIAYKDTQNRFLKINQTLADFMGKPRGFFEGVSLYDILPSALAQSYHEEDLAIIRTGEAHLNVVEEMQTPLGEKRWIRSDKKPILNKAGEVKGIVIFSVDITSQIAAERRLKQNERLFRNIIDESPYAILILDLGMKILHANSHAIKELRYDPDTLTTLSLYDMLKDSDRYLLQSQMEHWESDEDALSLDLPLQGSLSETRSHRLLIKAIKNDANIPIYYTCVLTSTTPPATAPTATQQVAHPVDDLHGKRVTATLYQAVRMIKLYTDLLESKHREQLPIPAQEFLTYIQHNTQQANRLVDQYYNFLHLDPNAPKSPQPISHIVTMAYEQFRPAIEERGTQVYISEMLPTLHINKAQLTQLFTQLFDNALHAPLTVQPHIIQVRCHRKGQYWQFAVEDNNIACPTDNFNELLALYQRIDNTEEEIVAAIGLATIQRIVEYHQGHIWIGHAQGKPPHAATGSTFYIALPAGENPNADA